MATGTLVDHSVGIGIEATQNVAVTPTRWYEWLESSDLSGWDMDVKHGNGLRQGSVFPRSARSVSMIPRGAGKLNLEVFSKGLGLLLQSCIGTATSTVVSGPLFQQLFTPLTAGLLPSLTVQEGIVRADGTIIDHTQNGCTVKNFKLAIPQDGIAILDVEVDMRGMHVSRVVTDGVTTSGSATVTSATAAFIANDTGKVITGTGIPAATTILSVQSPTSITLSANASATGAGVTLTIGVAYATPSYASAGGSLFGASLPQTGAVVVNGTLTVPTTTALGSIAGGVNVVGAKSWEFSQDNMIDDKREVLGGRNQPTTGNRKGDLKIVTEYDAISGPLFYQAQISHTTVPLLLTSTTTEVIGTGLATLQLAIPAAYVNKGAIPTPTNGTVPITNLELTVEDNLVAPRAYYLVLRTADATL